jgi:hypothetical protein
VTSVAFERFSPYFFNKEQFGLTLSPWPLYGLLFPEGRVNLSKVAYFFDGEWKDKRGEPETYIRPAKEACNAWSKAWNEENVYFCYVKGPGFVKLLDSRPRVAGGVISLRETVLKGPASSIYLWCDENRSHQSVCEMISREFGSEVPLTKIDALLDQMVTQGFMYREQNRYLSLAVRRKPPFLERRSKTSVAN